MSGSNSSAPVSASSPEPLSFAVHSLPDPRTLPGEVRAEFVPIGGHVGFVEGRPWRATSWAERRAVDFLAAALDGGTVC